MASSILKIVEEELNQEIRWFSEECPYFHTRSQAALAAERLGRRRDLILQQVRAVCAGTRFCHRCQDPSKNTSFFAVLETPGKPTYEKLCEICHKGLRDSGIETHTSPFE
jgi:hypothetical protein